MAIPLKYNVRSLLVRRVSTAMTAAGNGQVVGGFLAGSAVGIGVGGGDQGPRRALQRSAPRRGRGASSPPAGAEGSLTRGSALGRYCQSVADEKTQSRRLEVSPRRLPGWIESFAERHGGGLTAQPGPDAAAFRTADGDSDGVFTDLPPDPARPPPRRHAAGRRATVAPPPPPPHRQSPPPPLALHPQRHRGLPGPLRRMERQTQLTHTLILALPCKVHTRKAANLAGW